MKVLGLMRVRNGEDRLAGALDSLHACCDAIYVIDDRSQDRTAQLLAGHPAVTNVFRVDPELSSREWFFPESMGLNLLYRMADFFAPDWVIALDHDQVVAPAAELRGILASLAPSVAAVLTPLVSVWNDPDYPLMVPLMGRATAPRGNIWRYHPGLEAGTKPLHNGYLPVNIEQFGRIERLDSVTFYQHGWDTLRKRIAKVDLYRSFDPHCAYNFGVPYDRGLLFGYERGDLKGLLREYRPRLAQRKAGLAPDAPD